MGRRTEGNRFCKSTFLGGAVLSQTMGIAGGEGASVNVFWEQN